MKKKLQQLLTLICFPVLLSAQVYVDQFDNGTTDLLGLPSGISAEEKDGELTLTGDGSSGAFALVDYAIHDQSSGTAMTIDVSGNNKIFVRAKASSLGTIFRMDVRDENGFVTTMEEIKKTLVNDYAVLTYEFGSYTDAGYGGTACEAPEVPPCPVDPSKVTNFQFYVDPGVGAFNGSVIVDFISVGEEPQVGPMSDVYQDHFDGSNLLDYTFTSPGYNSVFDDSKWTITGDGTAGQWDPMTYFFHNMTTGDSTDIDMTSGENKLYVRMKSSIENTPVRFDVGDIDGFISTEGSIQNIVGTEFKTYEYNYSGVYNDLGYGGTPCDTSTAPCPVNGERISFLTIFVTPGVAAFSGEITIEYISVGTPLENDPGDTGTVVYGDHFGNNDAAFISAAAGYSFVEAESNITIMGDGGAGQYESIVYSPHDQNLGEALIVDATANNKIFMRAKSSIDGTLLRVDLVDTANYHTTQPSITRNLTTEYQEIQLDFSGAYFDSGYGGTACMPPMPNDPACPVDGSVLEHIFFYVNPGTGLFDGQIDIDYISFGAPLGEDIKTYSDHFDNEDRSQISDAGGFTIEETGTEMVITGDGTSGQYTSFSYTLHDQMTTAPVMTDLTSNNKLYVKVKSSVAGTPLRIDLVDAEGYATTEPATLRNMQGDYSILEFDYTGTYVDAGYGGTACMPPMPNDPPCPVDGTTISNLLIYVDPDNGAFDGTVTIDWISTIEPLEPLNPEPTGLINYSDEFKNGDNSLVSDPDGFSTTENTDENWIITGDGTASIFAAIDYTVHDQSSNAPIIADIKGSDNKLFVRAKSSVADIPMRIDLVDHKGFVTSEPATSRNVPTDWTILEYNYIGTYTDGGYGGTPCMDGPCPVDGERVSNLLFYVDPENGAFEGEVSIDWISAGMPLMVNVVNPSVINEAKVYPLPVQDQLIVQLSLIESGAVSYRIFDLTGRQLQANNLSNQVSGSFTEAIDVQNLNTGMYLLLVEVDGKAAFNTKIVKQ